MKRFWDHATIEPEGEGWYVLLDGRPVRLPGGTPLQVDRKPLADAIAAEWDTAGGAKGGEMSYADLPLTRIAGTAQERVARSPEPMILELARYGETDLLCYRAEGPDELCRRQRACWQPMLDWAAESLGAHLRVTTSVIHIAQEPQALAALASAVAAYRAPELAALGVAVPALGSLVLGLGLAAGELDAAEAYALSTLDDTFQAEIWGEDEEASARRRAVGEEVAIAGRFLALCRT
jgi:chaperone required for assembly of F1-ATPase